MATQTSRPARQYLALPGQLLAWYLILLPLSTLLLTVATPTPQGMMGRLQVFALAADAVLHPVVGLFLGTLLAGYFNQHRLRRVYSVLAAIGGVALVVLGPLYLLDAVQTRGRIRPELATMYDMHMLRTVGQFVLVGLLLLVLAVVGWRAATRDMAGRQVREDDSSTLVGSARRPAV